MDKVEYKIRADEIKALIGEGKYADAVNIADTIDWKRVKSVSMLCTISDLYKINRRYEESRDILLMAYDRHPTGRAIVYSLCELAIKMGEFVQAVEFYKEFVRIAPRDTGRYILQYKLYEAQEVSLEERIAVLEEFKKHDYRERWAYELAYLYHRVGLTTECIEECDEMFLWFGEGRYVMKALELKMLHEPLSPEQQDRYNRFKASHGGHLDASIVAEKDEVGRDESNTIEIKQPTKEMPPVTDEDIKTYNMGEYRKETQEDTSDLDEVSEEENLAASNNVQIQDTDSDLYGDNNVQEQAEPEYDPYQIRYPHITEIKEPSVDVSDYNTINLQETLAQGLREALGSDDVTEDAAENTKIFSPVQDYIKPDTAEIFDDNETEQEPQEDFGETRVFSPLTAAVSDSATGSMNEVFFDSNTQDIPTVPDMGIDIKYGGNGPILGEAKGEIKEALEEIVDESVEESEIAEESQEVSQPDFAELSLDDTVRFGTFVEEFNEKAKEPVIEEPAIEEPVEQTPVQPSFGPVQYEEKPLEDEVPGAVIHPNASYRMPSHFERMLAQESDGQISMAVEPEPQVEKQITGQISIAEYMENWEQFKKDQQQKQFERVKKRVADETGDMFADYDEKTKAGLQEKIEKAISDAIKKERHDKASGRGDWSKNREDVINDAVAEVMDQENVGPDLDFRETTEIPEAKTTELYDEDTEEAEQENVPEEVVKEAAPKEEPSESKTTEEPTTQEEPQQAVEEKTVPEEDADSEEDADEDDEDQEEKEPQKPQKAPEKKDEQKPKKHHIGNREIEERVRTMTPEEKELFGPYIHHKKSRKQIINAIDNLSMDAFTGNAIVTGEEGAGTVNLAKGLIKAVQASDSNFSGKVAKITANTLNKKSTASIFDKLANGALIIQRAADLLPETVNELLKVLQEENKGLIIVMEDTREDMDRFLEKNPSLKQSFNVRVDIEALDDDSLVAYARQYAYEKEYAIDNLGILALHTRISERQTLDHDVTVAEVKDIIDDAIYYAEKKSVGHFVDLIVNKRYDENDMVILREKDFMH